MTILLATGNCQSTPSVPILPGFDTFCNPLLLSRELEWAIWTKGDLGLNRYLLIATALASVLLMSNMALATHEGCTHFIGDSGHQVNGTPGNDHCHGTSSPDLMNAGDGADDFSGRDGNDFMSGQNGHDLLNGDEGADSIDGGNGHDDIRGYNGHDYLDDYGDTGDIDRICDGPGGDSVRLNDSDNNDTWYTEGGPEVGDSWLVGSGERNDGSSCPLSGS